MAYQANHTTVVSQIKSTKSLLSRLLSELTAARVSLDSAFYDICKQQYSQEKINKDDLHRAYNEYRKTLPNEARSSRAKPAETEVVDVDALLGSIFQYVQNTDLLPQLQQCKTQLDEVRNDAIFVCFFFSFFFCIVALVHDLNINVIVISKYQR
jgi:hypothetical protein